MKKLRRILVVDGSRVVRATLAKHLQGEFEIVEEGDGESAWQTLMLDASIVAVISGLRTPRLEAHDLLARLRVSSMRRLRSIPFVLIVSDVDNQAEREFDRTCGVAGFITKSMKKSAIRDYLDALLGGKSLSITDLSVVPDAVAPTVPLPMMAELMTDLTPDAIDEFGTSSLTASLNMLSGSFADSTANAESEAGENTLESPFNGPLDSALTSDLAFSAAPVAAAPVPLSASNSAAPAAPMTALPADNDKLLSNVEFDAVLADISFTGAAEENVCALVFAIDRRQELIDSFGEDVLHIISKRFADMLVAKVGAADAVGRWRGDQLAIVSHRVDLRQGVHFAHRVCKSLAKGQITIRGKKVRLTASAGVASSSDDDAGNGPALFALADKRLEQALVCGGNTVSAEFKPFCPLHARQVVPATLIDALLAQGTAPMVDSIGTLGLKLLPLLELLDQELALKLPLAKIAEQLRQRAATEGAG